MEEFMLKSLLIMTGMIEFCFSVIMISGCGSVQRKSGFDDVGKTIKDRTDQKVYWQKSNLEDQKFADSIHEILQGELSLDSAVQIAFLQNRSLQATFEELGIAQADLVQAGLLQNPVFSGHVRFPDDSDEGTNTEFAIMQNFMDLFLVPLRKKLAAEQFKEVELRVSEAAWHLFAEVRQAYFTLQGLEHTQSMLKTIVQAAQAGAEFATRQRKAGNINELDLASEQVSFEEVRLELLRNKAEVIQAREELNRLMGFSEKPSWKISDKMPNLPAEEPPVKELEIKALAQNLELAVLRQEIQVLERNLVLTRRGIVSTVDVGFNTEQDPDSTRVTGPMFDLELPIFNRNQAATRRIEAELRQSRYRLADKEAQLRSEVRSTWQRLKVTRKLIGQYRKKIIPLREKIVAESQKHNNFMLIGIFQLLQAKREEINAYQEYIETFQSYWKTRTDLEKAIGYRLLDSEVKTSKSSVPKVSHPISHTHHQGEHS